MGNTVVSRRHSVVFACLALTAALVAALGISAFGPANALAAGKTQTMNIVTKLVESNKDGKATYTFGYNSDFLLTSRAFAYKNEKTSTTYTYKNRVLKKEVSKYNGKKQYTVTYKSDKKGRVTSGTIDYGGGTTIKSTYKYDKKGLLAKVTNANITYTNKYNNKGLRTSVTEKIPSYGSYTVKYAYDKKGYLKSMKSDGQTTTYTNTYKKGLLTKRKAKQGKDTWTTTYTYKKVKVPTAAVKMVKMQQNAIFQSYPFEGAHV